MTPIEKVEDTAIKAEKTTITLKDAIGIITIVVGIVGSYYMLKQSVNEAKNSAAINAKDIILMQAQINSLQEDSKAIIRLDERFKSVEKKTDEMYDIIVLRRTPSTTDH